MESRGMFFLILATVVLAPDYVRSLSIHVTENPVPVGTNVTLYTTASVTAGQWRFNNSFIVLMFNGDFVTGKNWNGRVTFNSTTSSLTIMSVRVKDSGSYVLETVNDTAQLVLSVQDLLEAVEVNPTGGSAIYNESLTLRCDVIGRVDRIQWWRNEHIITPDERIVFGMENKTLTLDPVQHSDKGYYQCQAFNGVSNMTSSPYKFEVIYGPETPNITGPTVGRTGYSVTFSCYASSYPPSHYRWYFHHHLKANTSEYVTPPLTKNMSGTYTCEAYNNVTGNNKTADIMLNVVDPIEAVYVEAPMGIPNEGDEHMLECNVTGPAKYIYWMKNGVKLQEDNTTVFKMDNKSVTFNPLKRSDAGNYSCKAMNLGGSMVSAPYKLLVNFGPETPEVNGPRFAETGRSANFTCSAMSVPPSHYSWWFNGTRIANTSAFTTDPLTLNMSGKYTCMAKNYATGKNSTNSKMLTVIEAIESVMINSSIPINLKNLTLICNVTGPYDMIYWKKNNLLLNTSHQDTFNHAPNYHIEKNMLHFTPVKLFNEGAYQCDAINKAGGHESKVYMLQVNYGPLSIAIIGPDSEKPGSNVSLKCIADCKPDCNFYWFFNNFSSQSIKNGSILSFLAAKENEGTFICMAMNHVTENMMKVSQTFTLTDHASAIPFPSRGSLMLIGVFTLFVPVMSN